MERYICTKADPWTPEKADRAAHPDAEQIGETDDSETYRCPNCGTRFEVTLPSH